MSFVRILKNIIEPAYNVIRDWCIDWFYYLPVKRNKIIFIQSCGGGYRCNLKYIAEEIHRQKLPYDMVWLVERFDTEIPNFIRKVKYNRIRAVYELATSHVMINNSKSLYPVRKKATQKFIYIPHGQPGCKCAEADGNLPDTWVKASKRHSSLTDVFVSLGKYHTEVLRDTFWVPDHAEIWETGFPRNDNFYRDTTDKQQEIRKSLGVPDGTRIAFYAPTFRDSGTTEAYDMDLHRVLNVLEKKTGDRWMFFVTLHGNFLWFKKPIYPFDERIWNMTGYVDIHELMLVADVLISDYSSTSLDFANMRRPVILYASDIEAYTAMRGLKDMYYRLPFPLAKDNDEMERNIMEYDRPLRRQMYEDWMRNEYGSVDDGHASERFVEQLKNLIRK